jgi:hypothetical protein
MSEIDGPSEAQIGLHLVRFEHPDTFFIRLVGDVSGNEASEIVAFLNQRSDLLRFKFTLTDMGRAGSLDSEAKRVLRTLPRYDGVAIFSASKAMRLIAQLINKAVIMWQRGENTPMMFFDTEAEARAWIVQHREVLIGVGS